MYMNNMHTHTHTVSCLLIVCHFLHICLAVCIHILFRYSVAPWMPGMMLFLVSIYAGSRALANLVGLYSKVILSYRILSYLMKIQ